MAAKASMECKKRSRDLLGKNEFLQRSVKDHEYELGQKNQKIDRWVEKTFTKRECCAFIPSTKDLSKCCCGATRINHKECDGRGTDTKWSEDKHTIELPTDAHGTIEFQGASHPAKAQYVRLSYNSNPQLVYRLLKEVWCLHLPKLLISVHGGFANFDLQPKLKRMFDRGLLRAAKTTGAWIMTGGTNTGVVKHVGDALGDSLAQSRNSIATIGIAPWGVIHNRGDLIGSDIVTPYHAVRAPKGRDVVLSGRHSYFLLADNGTQAKFGAEIALRKNLEKYFSQQNIHAGTGGKSYGTPLVCLVLEGGTNIIRTVLEFVTDKPPVPVVVADGSGRAADLLAFTHKYAQDDGTMPENLRDQLIVTIERTFQYARQQAEKVFIELMLCVRKKELITVFRIGEESEEIDLAILTALLKGQKINSVDQLALTLTWNRVDIARSHIFAKEQDWPERALIQAMMDALIYDRVDFVKLFLETGVNMQKWLTIPRLEELYNKVLRVVPTKSSPRNVSSVQKQHPATTLRNLIHENKKHIPPDYRYTLNDIGLVIEQLMGGAFRASYCRRRFKNIYSFLTKKGKVDTSNLQPVRYFCLQTRSFKYPFSELMVWAVLFRRQSMATFMWQHGEEALAKALVAMKLYKSMTHEAEQNDLEMDVTQELKTYARDFANLATELLEHCYKSNDDKAQQLLTYELCTWSDMTCLSLAVAGNHREFLANSSCQILLTEMWMGGLRMTKYTSLKVILSIVFFPVMLLLDFKSKEELQLMPQTVEEHIHKLEDSDTDSDSELEPRVKCPDHYLDNFSQPEIRPLEEMNNGPKWDQISFRQGSDEGRKNSQLNLAKKIYEFYTAPITKFWMHTIGYVAFLLGFTYFVLAPTPEIPSALECYIISYVFTLTIEKVREVLVSEPTKCLQKLGIHFSKLWNVSDAIAITLFVIALVLRLIPSALGVGRVFYCVDVVLWYVRVLDLFSVNKHLGPYTMMIGKMLKDMLYFIVILLLMMIAFGILRQSVTHPYEHMSWKVIWKVFHEPYFMLYGEVYAGDIDPPCSDDPGAKFPCVPGRWVVPALMAIYLIVANILLINLLIAVFNNTFQLVNAISNQVWKFQRYSLVIEYESLPILPPPAIIICHIYQLWRIMFRKCRGKDLSFLDNGLKLFLDDDDVEQLHDFEEECTAENFREKEISFQGSMLEQIKVTTNRVENISLRLDDISQKENSIKLSLQTVDHRLAKLEEIMLYTSQTVWMMHNQLAPSPGESDTSPQPCRVPSNLSNMTQDKSGQVPPFCTQSDVQADRSEARLWPFTDYKVRRPQYTRALSLGASTQGGSLTGMEPVLSSQSGNLIQEASTCVFSVPYKKHHEHKKRERGIEFDIPGKSKNTRMKRPTKVIVAAPSLPSVSNVSSSVSTKLEPGQLTESRQTVNYNTIHEDVWENPGGCHSVTNHTESSNMTNKDIIYSNQPSSSRRTSSMPINSIVTPTRSEYSSITDDIDTSCVDFANPRGSPTSSRLFSFGVDVDLYTKKVKAGLVGTSEERRLRGAEESHHSQLENVIRRRMRQLSLTETDSLVELAKHVIRVEQDELADALEVLPHSDDEDLHPPNKGATLNVDWGESLKTCVSEPSLVTSGQSRPDEEGGSTPSVTARGSLWRPSVVRQHTTSESASQPYSDPKSPSGLSAHSQTNQLV